MTTVEEERRKPVFADEWVKIRADGVSGPVTPVLVLPLLHRVQGCMNVLG